MFILFVFYRYCLHFMVFYFIVSNLNGFSVEQVLNLFSFKSFYCNLTCLIL